MAALTWTNPDIWHAVGTGAGTATDRPTGTVGLYAGNVSGIGVHLEAPDGSTVNGGALRCWVRNKATTLYNRCTDMDITVPAAALQGYYFTVNSAGPGVPAIDREAYYVWVPDGVTAAGGCTVYLNGTPGGTV